MGKETEQKSAQPVMSGYEAFNRISSDIADIEVKLQRAYTASDMMRGDFFWCRKEYYEKHASELLGGYETAEAFSGIVNDYLYEVREMLEALQKRIEALQEQLDENSEHEIKTEQGSGKTEIKQDGSGSSDLSWERSRLCTLAYSAEDPEKIRCAAVFLEAATR